MADAPEPPIDDAPPRGELARPPVGGGGRAGGRVPPHNLQAEESLLGAMMLSRDAIAVANQAVGADDFYKPAHAHVFDAISALYASGEPVDGVTVAEQLRRADLFDAIGGAGTLAHLQTSTPATSNAAHYAKIVEENSLMRKLIGVAGEISEIGYSQPDDVEKAVDTAETMVFDVAERRVSDTLASIHDLMEGSLDHLEELYERGDSITGLATGYHDLDGVLAGLQDGALVVVGARPAMGKTAMGLGVAANAALEAQRPVLLFSLEMSHLELTQRLLCSEARVDSKRIRTGNLAEADWSRISRALGRLGDAPIWIDDNPNTTVMDIRAKARRLKAKIGDLGLVVVDYLQLMTGRNEAESRQVEVAEISRGLKILARELETPVVALSQLSRGLEQRTDKRPMLADLRESGCLTADSRIVRADTGAEVTMGELLSTGQRDIPVWTLDERYRLVRGRMSHVFPSGTKQVYELRLASGRTLEASGNHPFLQLGGWTPLDELLVGDRIAVGRCEPEPSGAPAMSSDELTLLAHLLGDGCTLSRHALQYTTVDPVNARAVVEAARAFGVEARVVRDAPQGRGGGFQVFLPAPHHLTHGSPNPIAVYLDGMGVWDKHSYEKFLPDQIFGQRSDRIALFLRHLWATDGTVCIGRGGRRPSVSIAYSTTSRHLAEDVVRLLSRLDIQARISRLSQGKHRAIHQVVVSGCDNQRQFIDLIGGQGDRAAACAEARMVLEGITANTNVDSVPADVWGLVHKAMPEQGLTARQLAAGLGMEYCGSALYKRGVSRERLARVADLVRDQTVSDLAHSDVLWDRIVAIEDRGEQPVFDATVEGTHNFMANGIVVHNSIEQDADVVLFIYRDEVYDPESPHRGTAEIIVSKHRNGPTGVARLAFLDHFTRFENMAKGV